METRLHEIISNSNKKIKIGVIPGHFATNHSHVNYYIDMTGIKTHHKILQESLPRKEILPSTAAMISA